MLEGPSDGVWVRVVYIFGADECMQLSKRFRFYPLPAGMEFEGISIQKISAGKIVNCEDISAVARHFSFGQIVFSPFFLVFEPDHEMPVELQPVCLEEGTEMDEVFVELRRIRITQRDPSGKNRYAQR